MCVQYRIQTNIGFEDQNLSVNFSLSWNQQHFRTPGVVYHREHILATALLYVMLMSVLPKHDKVKKLILVSGPIY